VTSTAERIASLPRRAPLTLEQHCLLDAWSGARLKEGQAAALRELYEARGLFAQLGVGEGKTGFWMLAPALMGAQRPAAVIPASLRDEAHAEFAKYHRAGWRVRLPRIITYTELSLRRNDGLLDDLDPDLLMLDEAWQARNLDAACTQKLDQWITSHPNVPVAVLAGTLLSANLMDYWHLALWALKENAPVPLQRSEAERWADSGVAAGELFGSHFRGTKGVVTSSGASCDASIEIAWWKPKLPEVLQRTIDDVLATSMRPDGEPLDDLDVVDCVCQLAGGGFYYVWDPPAPEEWLRPRRAWHAYERAVRDERILGLESTERIRYALDTGAPVPYADVGRELLAAWRAIEPTFKPNQVARWVTGDVLAQVAEHTRNRGVLIWTRYTEIGEALEREHGIPYYGGGTRPQNACPTGQTLVLSIKAHATGRNLQAWRRNLVLTPPAEARLWEQLIGRTHRQGQLADLVEVEIIDAIDYHRAVMSRVRYTARADGKTQGSQQRLIRATWKK
jgi:hypothetical protein